MECNSHPSSKALADEMVASVRDFVGRSMSPLDIRLAELEAKIATLERNSESDALRDRVVETEDNLMRRMAALEAKVGAVLLALDLKTP